VAVVESTQNVIASVVGEQSTTTNELGRSIDGLAETSGEITATIEVVRESARTTATDATGRRAPPRPSRPSPTS